MGPRPDNPYVPPSMTATEVRSNGSDEYRLATRSARLAASFFDGAIYLAAFVVFFGLCSAVIGIYVAASSQNTASGGELGGRYWPLFYGGAIPALVVQWYLIARDGQTIGKKIVHIKIIRSNGAPVGFVHGVMLRSWLLVVIGAIPAIGWLITVADVLMILGARRRCLHDYAADTVVIKSRRAH